MTDIIYSNSLNEFVEKYFVKMDFSDIKEIKEEYLLEILSQIEQVIVKVRENFLNIEDSNNPVIWLNREMCLRGLIILSQLEDFSKILEESGHLQRTTTLLGRLIEEFSNKILEDPEIVQAIQEERLEEEIERRMPKNIEFNTRISSFMQALDKNPLESIPEDYEEVPEDF